MQQNLIFDFSRMFLSFQMTFNFATATIIYVALEIIYILEPSSLIIELRYFNFLNTLRS